MEINRRDFITKVSAIAALSVLPSSFVAAMGNEKVEKAKPKYPTLKCDVVVVGAGPGGVPAAIAAARQGAKVILLEEDNTLSSRYELRLHLPSDERHRHGRNHAECTDSRRLPGSHTDCP